MIIKDELDPNVKFVSASDGGTYAKTGHVVTWTLKDVPAGKQGKVTLKVKVLEGALTEKGGPGKVVNDATVKVGNDSEFRTEEVSNPVKKETPPGPGPKTGDDSHSLLWGILALIALIGAGCFGVKLVKDKKSKKTKE